MRKALVVLLILLAPFVFGDSLRLSVDQAVDLALKNNLSVEGADVAVSVHKRLNDWSFNTLFPSLTVGAGPYILNQPQASDVLAAVVPQGNGVPAKLVYYQPNALSMTASVTAQWTLTLASLQNMAQASIDYKNSVLSREQAVQQVTTRVREAYFQLFVLQDSISLTQNQLDNAVERLRQVNASYRAGLAKELDLMQAQIAQDSLKPILQGYRQSRQQAVYAFESLLGIDPDTDLVLTPKPELKTPATLLDPLQLVQKYSATSLDVRMAVGQETSAKQHLSTLDASLWPALAVQWTADPLLNNPYQSNWLNGTNWIQQTGGLTVQLSWKLDSFLPGSSFWVNRGNLADQQKQSSSAVLQAKRDWEAKVRLLVDSLQGARANLDAWKNVAQSADRAQQLTEAEYHAGTKTVLDVNETALSAESAHLNVMNAEYAVYSKTLELQDALGVSLVSEAQN